MRRQVEVVGVNSQSPPFSSIAAMATPPRPEKRYIFPWRVVEAEPTRGEGLGDDVAAVMVDEVSVVG